MRHGAKEPSGHRAKDQFTSLAQGGQLRRVFQQPHPEPLLAIHHRRSGIDAPAGQPLSAGMHRSDDTAWRQRHGLPTTLNIAPERAIGRHEPGFTRRGDVSAPGMGERLTLDQAQSGPRRIPFHGQCDPVAQAQGPQPSAIGREGQVPDHAVVARPMRRFFTTGFGVQPNSIVGTAGPSVSLRMETDHRWARAGFGGSVGWHLRNHGPSGGRVEPDQLPLKLVLPGNPPPVRRPLDRGTSTCVLRQRGLARPVPEAGPAIVPG